MASVFLSYDRENAPAARSIAKALEKSGYSVWWDQRIHGGAEFSREIERALGSADAVLVLWSKESIDSAWVRDEAASGRDRGRLVPLSIDGSEGPLGFRQFHTLSVPKGKLSASRLGQLLIAIEAVTGAPRMASGSPPHYWQIPLVPVAILAIIALIALGLSVWKPWSARHVETALSVVPAAAVPASQALANELTTKLSGLNASSALRVRMVDATHAEDADLLISVSASSATTAALTLKSGRDSSILWSQDFEQPDGSSADLLQQLAFTAARVTGCTAEGLDGPVELKAPALTTYLKACAQLSEIVSASTRPATPLLLEVLKAKPRFTPAWSKLLLAEAEMTDLRFTAGEQDLRMRASLIQHIKQARAIDPNMAEAKIAEASLLPVHNFYARSQAIWAAAGQKSDDPIILDILAGNLAATGYLRDAVETANRAATLDPLSPKIRSTYITLLAYAGSFDAAERELQEAEKLWPGTATVADARFRFHYRYGDPKIARTLFEERANVGGRGPRLIIAAREDPNPIRVRELLGFVRERLRNMENPSAGLGFAILAFGQFGQPGDVISTLLSWPETEDVAIISEVLFRPEFTATRRDKRFMMIAKRAGLLDLWRKSNEWPDFCTEPGQTYDCRAEAAKLG